MRTFMKILKCILITCFALSMVHGQSIKKDGNEITTFTKEQALEMLKARDAQWEEKIAKANTLIEFQKITISKSDSVIIGLEEQAKLDSLLLLAQRKRIDLLKANNNANEKMVKLVKPTWYENRYLWFVLGFLLGK